MEVYFNLQGFPRTLSRTEWRDIWRWKRVAKKQVEDNNAVLADTLRNSKLPEYIKRDIIDKLVFPPLLIHDKQRL